MTNPRLSGRPQSATSRSLLHIVWDVGTERGAELPRAYFAAGKLKSTGRDVGPDGPPIEDAVSAVGDREIVVTLLTTVDALRSQNLRFTIEFPDRKNFIACEHDSSTTDHYDLKADIVFDSNGAITKATLTESGP